jgi:hypothetical protein
MSTYENATVVRERIIVHGHPGELHIRLLHGENGDAGRKCIHRVQMGPGGRVQSDIVYLYDTTVAEADVDRDFDLLAGGGLVSVGQLHHTESMLNRGAVYARR